MSDEFDADASEYPGLKRAGEIARRLAEADDLDETLQRVVDLAMNYIDNCDGATMMLVRRDRVTTPASTSMDARGADLAQYRTGEGPCLTALREHEVVVIEDIRTDDRCQPPTAAALTAATQLMAWVIQDADIDPGAIVPTTSSGVGTARFNGKFHPRAVTGHSASNITDCPGEHLRQLLSPIRDRMRQLLAGQQASSWDGLAAEHPPAAAEPAAAKPATPNAEARAGSATGGRSLSSQAPLVSPADRTAGTLRDSGLRSLAERLG